MTESMSDRVKVKISRVATFVKWRQPMSESCEGVTDGNEEQCTCREVNEKSTEKMQLREC